MESDLDHNFSKCVSQKVGSQDLSSVVFNQNKTRTVVRVIWEIEVTRFPNAYLFRAFTMHSDVHNECPGGGGARSSVSQSETSG